jgi:hypothetical protein
MSQLVVAVDLTDSVAKSVATSLDQLLLQAFIGGFEAPPVFAFVDSRLFHGVSLGRSVDPTISQHYLALNKGHLSDPYSLCYADQPP